MPSTGKVSAGSNGHVAIESVDPANPIVPPVGDEQVAGPIEGDSEGEVELGGTSCKVPLASEPIAKVEKAGRLGKKRKTIKC